jgi:hypothetical protein
MHIFSDVGGGLPVRQSGAFYFFCVQALGIVIEDGVQAVWRKVTGRDAGVLGRIVGYAWVAAWVVWSSPVWVYPVVLAMRREDAILGFKGIAAVILARSAE